MILTINQLWDPLPLYHALFQEMKKKCSVSRISSFIHKILSQYPLCWIWWGLQKAYILVEQGKIHKNKLNTIDCDLRKLPTQPVEIQMRDHIVSEESGKAF